MKLYEALKEKFEGTDDEKKEIAETLEKIVRFLVCDIVWKNIDDEDEREKLAAIIVELAIIILASSLSAILTAGKDIAIELVSKLLAFAAKHSEEFCKS